VRPLHADAMTLADGTFTPFIAMARVDGQPLDSIVLLREERGQKPLSISRLVKMLRCIAIALSKAHRFQVPGGSLVSVIHCDLKPENIVITDVDSPVDAKILDFGIAKARDTVMHAVGRITDSEQASPFTPSYGAPEQWVPKRFGQSGPWTDVWGLALTLVECLTSKPPIGGEMHAMMGTALDRTRRPTPRNEGADVSDEVEAVFEKALAVDPRDRYSDIRSFWTDLERAIGVTSSFARQDRRRGDSRSGELLVGSDDEYALAGQEFDGFEESSDGGRARPDALTESGEFYIPSGVDQGGEQLSDISLADDLPSEDRTPLDEDLGLATADQPDRSDSVEMDIGDIDLDHRPAPVRPGIGGVARPPKGPGSDARPAVRPGPPPGGRRPAAAPQPKGLGARLVLPLVLVGIAIAATVLDISMGTALGLGPVRLRYLGIVLAIVGIVLAFRAVLADSSDG